MGRPYIYYLLLSELALDLLYISNFLGYKYSNFELIKNLKLVKLRRLYSLLKYIFLLGSYVLIGLKRITLVLSFLVFFIYNFNELPLLNSLNTTSLSLKNTTRFISRDVR